MQRSPPIPSIDLLPEYVDADLGDERRSERLLRVAAAASREPAASFRCSAEDDAALEATYRFLNNPNVQADDIFGPHERQTFRRAAEHKNVLVVHDTTELAVAGVCGDKPALLGQGRLQRVVLGLRQNRARGEHE